MCIIGHQYFGILEPFFNKDDTFFNKDDTCIILKAKIKSIINNRVYTAIKWHEAEDKVTGAKHSKGSTYNFNHLYKSVSYLAGLYEK